MKGEWVKMQTTKVNKWRICLCGIIILSIICSCAGWWFRRLAIQGQSNKVNMESDPNDGNNPNAFWERTLLANRHTNTARYLTMYSVKHNRVVKEEATCSSRPRRKVWEQQKKAALFCHLSNVGNDFVGNLSYYEAKVVW